MGDVAFRAVVNDLYGRLVSKVIKELALLWGVEDNISTLKNDFDQIKADLQDAEETPMIIKEKAQELFIKRLRSTLLMIENLLQDISTEALLCRLYKERGIIDKVRTFFCCKNNQLMFRFKIVHRIKAIRKKLEDLGYKRSSYNTPRKTTHIDMGFESHMPDRETSSRMHDSSNIIGKNEDAEMVVPEPNSWLKMPPRRNQRPLDDVYEREMEERLMARVEQRLGQVVDQLADRMNDMMNQRRRGAEGSVPAGGAPRVAPNQQRSGEGRVNGGDISELEPIGREIAEKCKGLPLAIKTLGSSMWSKTSASEWERVKRNTIWEENKILPALKLSYDNLVPYLKRCFAYCRLFPKGYEMEKEMHEETSSSPHLWLLFTPVFSITN
ncbi:hypothetical protein E3N88_09359 [Mikania micrantha]|uniref:Disease resistance N-terminal domain-containing protein n=1 Tax=Mikania micrantha TaxID=192012 RepID=A0A5N6PL41_9ASTR|nr:hypothetical protein E3N88_09359 [Mikania micrantha]